MTRLLLKTAFLMIFGTLPLLVNIAEAQVLQIPKPSQSESSPVELEGTVIESKKYSFVLAVDGKKYKVKLLNGTKPVLRLNKPAIDLVNRKVTVQPLPQPVAEGARETQKGSPARLSYDITKPLFIRVRFEHLRQKQRIMSAKVKRLNNYELGFTAFEPGSDPLVIVGQIELAADNKTLQLKLPGRKAEPVRLGHHNAKLVGTTISSLVPHTTGVFVKGVVSDDAINASMIEFWPIHRPADN